MFVLLNKIRRCHKHGPPHLSLLTLLLKFWLLISNARQAAPVQTGFGIESSFSNWKKNSTLQLWTIFNFIHLFLSCCCVIAVFWREFSNDQIISWKFDLDFHFRALERCLLMQKTSTAASLVKTQGLHQLVGGSTCPGYSMQRFCRNSVKFLADQHYPAFIWNKCCHLMLC